MKRKVIQARLVLIILQQVLQGSGQGCRLGGDIIAPNTQHAPWMVPQTKIALVTMLVIGAPDKFFGGTVVIKRLK